MEMSLAEDPQSQWSQANEWVGRIQFARHLMICIRLYESFQSRSSNYLFFPMINSNVKYNWIFGDVFASFEFKRFLFCQFTTNRCASIVLSSSLYYISFGPSKGYAHGRHLNVRNHFRQVVTLTAERNASKCSLYLETFDYFWRSNQVGCALCAIVAPWSFIRQHFLLCSSSTRTELHSRSHILNDQNALGIRQIEQMQNVQQPKKFSATDRNYVKYFCTYLHAEPGDSGGSRASWLHTIGLNDVQWMLHLFFLGVWTAGIAQAVQRYLLTTICMDLAVCARVLKPL